MLNIKRIHFIVFLTTIFSLHQAPAVTSPIANFKRIDSHGKKFELYDHSNKKGVVIIVQGNDCPVFMQYSPIIKKIESQFSDSGFSFFLLNANPQDKLVEISQSMKNFSIQIPVIIDTSQKMAKALGFRTTAEVVVLSPKTWQIVYRGAIDDQINYDGQKMAAKANYLVDAILALRDGKKIKRKKTQPFGCFISYLKHPKP